MRSNTMENPGHKDVLHSSSHPLAKEGDCKGERYQITHKTAAKGKIAAFYVHDTAHCWDVVSSYVIQASKNANDCEIMAYADMNRRNADEERWLKNPPNEGFEV